MAHRLVLVLVRILGNLVDLADLVDLAYPAYPAYPVGLVPLEEPWPSVAQFLGSIVGRVLGPCRTLSRHGRLLDHSGCICRRLEDSSDRSTFLAAEPWLARPG